jgi:hypothetical protein
MCIGLRNWKSGQGAAKGYIAISNNNNNNNNN